MAKGAAILAAALLLVGTAGANGQPTVHGEPAVQKLALAMVDYGFVPDTVTVEAGAPVEITLTNRGERDHEFMVYDRPPPGVTISHKWAEETNYFRGVQVEVTGGRAKFHKEEFVELVVAPGQTATVRFTPLQKGTFEMGCLIRGHYERGHKGTFIVR